MRKNSHTPSAPVRVAAGTEAASGRPELSPKPVSATNRFTTEVWLKQMPLRIQLNMPRAASRNVAVDWIKNAAKSRSSNGKATDARGLDAQQDSKTPYPANNVQSNN